MAFDFSNVLRHIGRRGFIKPTRAPQKQWAAWVHWEYNENNPRYSAYAPRKLAIMRNAAVIGVDVKIGSDNYDTDTDAAND